MHIIPKGMCQLVEGGALGSLGTGTGDTDQGQAESRTPVQFVPRRRPRSWSLAMAAAIPITDEWIRYVFVAGRR